MNKPALTLEQASQEIQLAVDLIYLLESHNIEPAIALKAIDIVRQDLLNKLAQQEPQAK